jgi:hypothetical protein
LEDEDETPTDSGCSRVRHALMSPIGGKMLLNTIVAATFTTSAVGCVWIYKTVTKPQNMAKFWVNFGMMIRRKS